jgi:hypothetical protein
MRSSSALLLTLLALSGCAAQHRPAGELTTAPAPRTIVRVEVTNIFDRAIEVYSGMEFLGTLGPNAHGSYPVEPTTERPPLYARWIGQQHDQQFDIASSRMVRYVYDDRAPPGR